MSEHRWVIRTLDAPQRRLMPPTDIDDITYEFETREFDRDDIHVISRSDLVHAPVAVSALCYGDFDIVEILDLGHVLQDLDGKLIVDALVDGDAGGDIRLTEAVIDIEDEAVEYFLETRRRDALAEGIDETPAIRLSYRRDGIMAWLEEMRPDVHAEIEGAMADLASEVMRSGKELSTAPEL